MAHSGSLRSLLLHHQDMGPQVHEGPGALQHPDADHCLQPLPDTIQPLDFLQSYTVLVDRYNTVTIQRPKHELRTNLTLEKNFDL